MEVWEEGEERDDGRRGEYWTEIGGWMLEAGLWMIGGRKTWPEVERKEVLDGV
jgi:hypothetical protein